MILVPVELSSYALSNGKEYPVHCFNLLKQITPGYTYINKELIAVLSDYLDRSNRTVRRYLKYLENKGFIRSHENIYHIVSWKSVFEMMSFKYISGVKADVTIIDDPQALFAGIVIGRLTNYQKYIRNRPGKGKTLNMTSQGSVQPGRSNYYPVSDRALASILQISSTKANRLKKKAQNKRYIDLKYNFYPFIKNGSQVQINPKNKKIIREYFEKIGYKLRIDSSGKVSILDSDLIKPLLKYKRSRNYL